MATRKVDMSMYFLEGHTQIEHVMTTLD